MSPFDNLKGINKEREVKERGKTTLETLLDVEKDCVNKYSKELSDKSEYKIEDTYSSLYESLTNSLKEVKFDKRDLTDFLYAKINHDYQENQAKSLGLYTGALLHLLSERNKEQGKRTIFYFGGNGNRFDYLFYGAREIDSLIVENISGSFLGNYIASFGGKANLILFNRINLNAEEGVVLWDVGNYGGRVKLLFGRKINNGFVFHGSGSYGGRINFVYGENIHEGNIFQNLGVKGGRIDLIYGNNIKGRSTFIGCGKDQGVIKLICAEDIIGDHTFFDTKIEVVLAYNTPEIARSNWLSKTEIDTFLTCEEEEFKTFIKKLGIKKILELVKNPPQDSKIKEIEELIKRLTSKVVEITEGKNKDIIKSFELLLGE